MHRTVPAWVGWAALAALLLSARATAAPAAPEVRYDLTPFALTAPPLAAAWDALEGRGGALVAAEALHALRTWRSAPADTLDPLAMRTARWLTARLELRLGARANATRTARELLALPFGAFTDAARTLVAEQLGRQGDPVAAATLRLARLPSTPGYRRDALAAVEALTRRGKAALAADLLEDALERPMDAADRFALTERLAQLHWRTGAREDARRIAAGLWWRARSGSERTRTERLLRFFKAPLDPIDRFAREVIGVTRPDAADRRVLKKTRLRGRHAAAARAWAEALYDRFEDPEAAAKRLAPYARKVRGSSFEPWFRYGEAEVLRKRDLDVEAVAVYRDVATRWPAHPLAPVALNRASGLLRYLNQAGEANALDQRLVAQGGHDDVHRGALWRVAFDAWLARNPGGAESLFAALSDQYGGEIDLHAMSWAERADYWRARAAEAAGQGARAQALYANVAWRFPASWYALLARDRLGAAAPEPGPGLTVARTVWLDTPVALLRLGATEAAIDELTRLLAADALPGSGRALLADLLAPRDPDRAARVLKKGSVPAVPVDDVTAEAYKSWYPFDFAEAVGAAAREHGVAPALLAGVAAIESRFNPRAESGPGAIGLCQLMPQTGVALGRRLYGPVFKSQQLFDPETNLRIAAYLLSLLRDRYGDQPAVLAAAYNAGNGPVARWLGAHGHLDTDAFVELIPYPQARRYVKRVLAAAEIYRRLYGLGDAPLPLPQQVRLPRAPRPTDVDPPASVPDDDEPPSPPPTSSAPDDEEPPP